MFTSALALHEENEEISLQDEPTTPRQPSRSFVVVVQRHSDVDATVDVLEESQLTKPRFARTKECNRESRSTVTLVTVRTSDSGNKRLVAMETRRRTQLGFAKQSRRARWSAGITKVEIHVSICACYSSLSLKTLNRNTLVAIEALNYVSESEISKF